LFGKNYVYFMNGFPERSWNMTMTQINQPAIENVVPNDCVTAYEKKLSEELGVSVHDVYLASGGTCTPDGDSTEDS
jgi:hypothetical protein